MDVWSFSLAGLWARGPLQVRTKVEFFFHGARTRGRSPWGEDKNEKRSSSSLEKISSCSSMDGPACYGAIARDKG